MASLPLHDRLIRDAQEATGNCAAENKPVVNMFDTGVIESMLIKFGRPK